MCVVDVPGTLIVNDEPAYTGLAPGQFVGLDLVENMYLGGVPNFQTIPRAAGFNQGFVGMSEFISRNLFSKDLCVCQNLFHILYFQKICVYVRIYFTELISFHRIYFQRICV